ncbi:MAG: LPXTG cell wall anchor domain-containing protein [Blastocatellia bacterium]
MADDGGSHQGQSNCPCPAQVAPSPQTRIEPDGNRQVLPNTNGASSQSVNLLGLMAIVAGILLWIRRL